MDDRKRIQINIGKLPLIIKHLLKMWNYKDITAQQINCLYNISKQRAFGYNNTL